MRTDTKRYIKGLLNEYPQFDKRMAALRKESVTIQRDQQLAILERIKREIEKLLDESDGLTRLVIEEVYIRQTASMDELPLRPQCYYGRSELYKLKQWFFEQLADSLGLY